MSRREYCQVCFETEGMNVILEFPAEQPVSLLGERDCTGAKDIQKMKKEIKEIFVSELQEKIKQSYDMSEKEFSL